MPNIYVNLPMPALNGAGAAVDVSAMGKTKTIEITGDMVKASVTVEASADGGVSWGPVISFTEPEVVNEQLVAATHLRVFVRNRLPGPAFTAVCNIGGDPGGAQAIVPAVPAFNGSGAASVGSALGTFKTFIVQGTFPGARVLIEGSNDGGVTWGPVVMFASKGGLVSKVDVSQQYRVSVAGRRGNIAFAAVVAIAAANDPQTSAGSLSNVQAFTYIATGAEGTAFNVPIPVAQPDALYTPWYSLYDVENHVTISFPVVGRTTLLLPVDLSAALTVGDTIRFIVANTP
jgi:hypothetical protein